MDRVLRAINAVLGRGAQAGAGGDISLVSQAFDQTSVGLTLVTPEGEFILVNRAYCEITGYSKEELVGRSFRKVTHPDDIAADERALKAVREAGTTPGPTEKRILRRDGRAVWVRRNAGLVRDDQGTPRFVIGAFEDLTERRARDKALQATNSFLTAIVETSPVAIYATDLEGAITLWNPAAERIFGFSREQAIGRRAPFVPNDRRDEARQLRERVLAGEVLTNLELERRRADGSPVVIHGSAAPLRGEENRIAGLLVICFDVTEAKRTEAAHKEQLHFTRALMDAIPNPVYFKDRDGAYRV